MAAEGAMCSWNIRNSSIRKYYHDEPYEDRGREYAKIFIRESANEGTIRFSFRCFRCNRLFSRRSFVQRSNKFEFYRAMYTMKSG